MGLYKPKGKNYYVMDFTFEGKRVKRSTKRTNKREALLVELATRKRLLDYSQFGQLEVTGH